MPYSAKNASVPSLFDGLDRTHHPLDQTKDILVRCSRVGFQWPDALSCLNKVQEEMNELRDALEKGDNTHAAEEFGDLLFALANTGLLMGLDLHESAAKANGKFETRFRAVETLMAEDGLHLPDEPVARMEEYWQKAKRME